MERQYPEDPTREVYDAAKSGDADLLSEVLQQMNSSERTSALRSRNLESMQIYGFGGFTNKSSPLIVAAENGNLDCVKIILKYKADIESGGDDNPKGYTPLFMAAANGHVDVLSYLVENGADVNSRLIDNLTPLMAAILNSQVNTAVFLIEHGAKLDIRDRRRGYTAAHYAAFHYSDSCDVLSCLVKNGADVNAHASEKWESLTPVMLAIKNGHLNAAVFLIKHIADVNVEGSDGKTALHYAVEHYDSSHHSEWCEVFSCVIKNGADINACAKGHNTPLMLAISCGNLNAAMFLIKHGADVNVQDRGGKTALHYAVQHYDSSHHSEWCEVFSCLIKNGADINACAKGNNTPLMLAITSCHLSAVIFLTEHGADVDIQNRVGKTALHFAVQRYHSSHHSEWCEVLSCLVENGADINARENNDNTPLMIASFCGHVNVVTFLIQHGAELDVQNDRGNTALHFAVKYNFSGIVHILLDHGATHLYNNKKLTPLLFASNNSLTAIVEELTRRPEFTKEQRIDALELLGASLATKELRDADIAKAFEYMKRGMEERFQDPSHPVLKQLMEPVESYHDRKESQTLEELAQIKGDFHAICMEGVYIKERFLGSDNYQFLRLIRSLATCHEHSRNFDICLRLRRHALEINQCHNHSNLTIDIEHLICLFYNMIVNKFPLRQDVVLEVLQKTGVELAKELDTESVKKWNHLVDHTVGLLQIFANEELFEEGKNPCVLVALKELVGSYLRNSHGNTLLHLAADGQHRMKIYRLAAKNPSPFSFPCTKTVKLLLNMGFSVNAVNSNGDTPLHRAVTFEPSNNNIHLMTDTLEVLLDGGAHHDFVNNDGKTAMDMARTHEARWILSKIKKLELKCIAARAVKKFGLPYLGMVPKTLEKYLSMH